MQISVESALLTEGSQPPSQPHAWGKEQTEARLKYLGRVLDEREREWRLGHSSDKFELITSEQKLRTHVS